MQTNFQCVLTKSIFAVALVLVVVYIGSYVSVDADQDNPCTLAKKELVRNLSVYKDMMAPEKKFGQPEFDSKEKEIHLATLDVLKSCGF